MTEKPQEDATVERKRPRRRWRILRYFVELFVALPVALGVIAATFLIGREVRAPHWLQTRIEDSATAVLNGGSLTFANIGLTLGKDLHLRARMVDAVLRDADSNTLARLPSVGVLISPRGIVLKREVLVQEVEIHGAQIGLRRGADGTIAVIFESTGTTVSEAESFVALLDDLDRVLEQPALEALESLRADGVIINYDDARANRSWTVDGGVVTVDLRGGVDSLRGQFSLLSGRPFVTDVDLSFDSPRGQRAATMGVTIRNGMANDLAVQTPALSWLSVLDAPITASIRASVGEDGGLGPMFASVEIRDGAIQPTPEARPIPIRSARTYLAYDPQAAQIRIDRLTADTAWGSLSASGRSYLKDWDGTGLPGSFETQIVATDMMLDPGDLYAGPMPVERASVDFRMQLDPFVVDVGAFAAGLGGQSINGDARITADRSGWGVSVDAQAERIDFQRVLPYWPEQVKVPARKWFSENVTDLIARDASLALRLGSGGEDRLAATVSFEDTRFRPNPKMPYIEDASGFVSLDNWGLTVMLDQGHVTPPQGGQIDGAGSVMWIDNLRQKRPEARFDLRTAGTLTSMLSFLDQEPWQFLTKAGQPVTLADGRAEARTDLRLTLKPHLKPDEVFFSTDAVVRDVHSETIVKGRRLTSPEVFVHADNGKLEILGPARIGEVPLDFVWSRALGKDAPPDSHLTASVELSPVFLSEFRINLPPDMVRGVAEGQLDVTLAKDSPPEFSLTSDLVGAQLSIGSVGWTKATPDSGQLVVAGQLGTPPVIDRFELSGAGLSAQGRFDLSEAGLDRATFSEVRVGDWFRGPVTLYGRGAGRPVEVQVTGGTLDLRAARFGTGDGAGGPVGVVLDRLTVSEGIGLSSFVGTFDTTGGFHGTFAGKLNDLADVKGQIETTGKGNAIRLTADNGGAVAMAAGLLPNASGGAFDMILTPTGEKGTYDGTLSLKDLQVREAPALAALLDAISVVGLLQQLGGQGLMFADVTASFRLTPDRIILARSSAIGAGLGISLDGVYMLASGAMDFQGVISPFYLLNGIGSVLTRPGEGLIGFNFTLGGTRERQQVGVNPLSVLTPGMFREIFRRAPPELNQ